MDSKSTWGANNAMEPILTGHTNRTRVFLSRFFSSFAAVCFLQLLSCHIFLIFLFQSVWTWSGCVRKGFVSPLFHLLFAKFLQPFVFLQWQEHVFLLQHIIFMFPDIPWQWTNLSTVDRFWKTATPASANRFNIAASISKKTRIFCFC